MTNQQLQYAYWQRMRQQQIYRAYVAGIGGNKKNAYKNISKITDDFFLNYLEYDAKNLDSLKAVEYLKKVEEPNIIGGRCTGIYVNDGTAIRQLDWYYNNESEFIVKMNADESRGIHASIGVTAASPKMTTEIAKKYITTGEYYDYFNVLPFFTVDGVNDRGIYAQSNVVNKNNIDININENGTDCCIVMLVRYILDHFDENDISSASSVQKKLLNNLHIYGTSKLGGYNSHILISHYDNDSRFNKSYVVEFTNTSCYVNEFPIMTNFRTILDNLNSIETRGRYYHLRSDWNSIELSGIGLERWDKASEFLEEYDGSRDINTFKQIRSKLNYTHAYDRSSELDDIWLTDNLSGDLNIDDARDYHDGTISEERLILFDNVLSGYKSLYDNRSRNTGITWHTTHGAIYDLINLSCNIQSLQNTSWNILFNGSITENKTNTLSGKWVLLDDTGKEIISFDDYRYYQPNAIEWKNSNNSEYRLIYSPVAVGVPISIWQLLYNDYNINETDEKLHDTQVKNLNVIKNGSTDHYMLKWIDQ